MTTQTRTPELALRRFTIADPPVWGVILTSTSHLPERDLGTITQGDARTVYLAQHQGALIGAYRDVITAAEALLRYNELLIVERPNHDGEEEDDYE